MFHRSLIGIRHAGSFKTLRKTGKIRLRRTFFAMIGSYLSDRQQINLDGTCTDNRQIPTGVPQGSILGPLHFLLHINGLDACSGDSKVTIIAGDTTLINAGNIEILSIQEDIELVSNCLVSKKLTVKADKCELMLLG